MVSVGTGATTSITLWVVADGRWQPQNFPFFEITDSEIAWDWSTSSSNFQTLLSSKEAALGGRGWEVESSLELSQYTIEQDVLFGGVNQGFGEPASAASAYLPVGDAGPGSLDAGEFEGNESLDAGLPRDGGPETADQVRQLDLTTLFAGIAGSNARVTRLRSDIAHTALTTDLQLQASPDQSEISNIREPGQQIGQPICPVFNTSCEQVGTLPQSEATALSATGPQGGGGGCSTVKERSPLTSPTALGAFLGLVGLVAARARRRRAAR
jgi:hypothetical protein